MAETDNALEDNYEVVEDKLYYITHLSESQPHYRVYVPRSLVPIALHYYHSHPLSGHMGIYKTYKRLHNVAYWPGMWTDIKQYVKKCVKCQTLKNVNRKTVGKIQQVTTTQPNHMIGVDLTS